MSGSILGRGVLRLDEDWVILRGGAMYTPDVASVGALHVVFVRSPVAHARVRFVDVAAAEAMPGVRAVFTSENLPLPCLARSPAGPIPAAMGRPPLAVGKVRFVGDIIAAVVAESRAEAVDAVEAVVIDFEPLPVVSEPAGALADDAVLLFEAHGSNVAHDFAPVGNCSEVDALAGAEVVVEAQFVNQRVAAVPLETNGIVAEPGIGGSLQVLAPTQMPFDLRDGLSECLGLAPESVRVVAPTVGGGFGAKTGLYPEYLIAAAAALRLGRPVRWTETREENLVAMTHGRGQVQHAAMGLLRDGTITGVTCTAIQDAGAYPGLGTFLPRYTGLMAQGPYTIPKVHFKAVSVVTNTTPISAYRGAGRPEATAFLERLVDMAAAELGLDPVEIRAKNFIPSDDLPVTTVTGANYDVGDFARALELACQLIDYQQLRREQLERRQRGDPSLLGIGVCSYIEVTAGAGRVREFGRVAIDPDGTAIIAAGTASQGQGHATTYAMIVSDVLGIPIDRIRVLQADTAAIPHGGGTVASRSMQIAGSALHQASRAVFDQACTLAAQLLEADPHDIVARQDGTVGVVGVPAKGLSWSELAAVARDPIRRPDGWTGALTASVDFDQRDATYPFGAHISVVEVETETGRTKLLRHVAVDDCGRILNPTLVAGQIHGGIAQGVAQALYEAIVYDPDGNPLTTTFVDYLVPSAAELPSFELTEFVTPTRRNPLGAKGIGESGTMGATTAITNAVIDALAPFGIRNLDMPLNPERLWRAMNQGRARP